MALNYVYTESPESKMRSPDRVFKLQLMPGMKPSDTRGLIDSRLFKDGEDAVRLHCVMDLETSLWSFKYSKGAVPGALEGRFTGFKQARDHAEKYFLNRNVVITEVLD